MGERAEGTFEINSWDEAPYDEMERVSAGRSSPRPFGVTSKGRAGQRCSWPTVPRRARPRTSVSSVSSAASTGGRAASS